MRQLWAKAVILLLFLTPALPVAAGANRLTGLRVAEKNHRVRLEFDFAAQPDYRLTRWTDPKRLWIEIAGGELGIRVRQPPAKHPVVGTVRVAPGKPGKELRLSIDLKKSVRHRAFTASHGKGVSLVVELLDSAAGGTQATNASKASAKSKTHSGKAHESKPVAKKTHTGGKRRPVVVIDAGHGGKDTGAIGPNGHREKDIVLSIAHRLHGMLRAERDLKSVMVRHDDRFVPLKTRRAIARNAQADLFVSLHADADPSGQVRGVSVYTLSESGGNRAAAGSGRAATAVLYELKKFFPVHYEDVAKARFMVLKCPDVPSILVETGFITHPAGERELANPSRQKKIARTLFYGIRRFLTVLHSSRSES